MKIELKCYILSLMLLSTTALHSRVTLTPQQRSDMSARIQKIQNQSAKLDEHNAYLAKMAKNPAQKALLAKSSQRLQAAKAQLAHEQQILQTITASTK